MGLFIIDIKGNVTLVRNEDTKTIYAVNTKAMKEDTIFGVGNYFEEETAMSGKIDKDSDLYQNVIKPFLKPEPKVEYFDVTEAENTLTLFITFKNRDHIGIKFFDGEKIKDTVSKLEKVVKELKGKL